MEFPEIQPVVWDDLSETGTGHLNKGLLKAHGLDEGGEPDLGIGGHDTMWFALRDLAFGDVDYPEPEVPENIARPEEELVLPPGVSEAQGRLIFFLFNLLLIEFRAERGFRLSQTLLRDPNLFTERRKEAEHAATIVERIRIDEEIHVTSLRLYLGELRNTAFRGPDGARIPGHEILDPIWEGIVQWATVDQPKLQAEQQRKLLTERILAHTEGPRILEAFEALADAG